eukprot:scpid75727/ scgid13513/ Putative nuclease HARBI1; Harbinger transposase-derived nuclease
MYTRVHQTKIKVITAVFFVEDKSLPVMDVHDQELLLAVLPIIVFEFLWDNDDDDDAAEEDILVPLLLAILGLREKRDSVPRIANYTELTVTLFNDKDFHEHFRMRRGPFELLLTEICANSNGILPLTHIAGGRVPTTPTKHLLITLWILGSQCCIRDVADRFGVSKWTVWTVIRRVCTILVNYLAPKFIKWPTGARVKTVSEGFEAIAKLPGVIGSIDGSHMEVKPPSDDMDSYGNRLSYYSIVLQAVCDSEMVFTNCFAGYPGSVHDARVLRNSELGLEAGAHQALLFASETYIIGDSAYPLETWLMVPFKQQGGHAFTWQQGVYNHAHADTRKVIERAFRLLKCRWRKLQMIDLDGTEYYPQIIVAACVLHNFCRLHDIDDVAFLQAPCENAGAANNPAPLDAPVFAAEQASQQRRQQLVTYLSS